ncbi:archease [Halomarina ordinaria]|uniref:Archease n=1 Tax=Halomarina ordinaria TaxID=3033939 RepID=A0ABD5UB20_9EURY|nr:archease [Halomarina sp. PSRA2]
MSFELLSHPADARFRATGPTLAAAFAEAARAFAAISEGGGDDALAFPLELDAEDREALLFDYLAELVLLQELEEVAVARAEDVTVEERANEGGYTLSATVRAGPIDDPLFDVKSPTYSEMRVEPVGEGWVLEATLDI